METQASNPGSGPVSGAPFLRAFRILQEKVYEALDCSASLSDDELTDALVAIERLAWQVDAAQNQLAAEANYRSTNRPAAETLSHRYGCASVHEYLQRITFISKRQAGTRIKLGKALRPEMSLTGETLSPDLPHLAAAAKAGAISPGSSRTIFQMLENVSWVKANKRDQAEKNLVEAATGIDLATGTLEDLRQNTKEHSSGPNLLSEYADDGLLDPLGTDPLSGQPSVPTDAFPALAQDDDAIRVMAKTWKQYLDQDGSLPDEKETLKQRGLKIGPVINGLVRINGRLTPEVAATFTGLSAAIHSPRTQNNKDSNASDGDSSSALGSGSTALPDLDGRTPAQKHHDAFAMIMNMASNAAETPNHGGAPVTVLVETTQEALETGGASWMLGPNSDTTLLTPQATAHAACTGALQYYAKNAAGKLVSLGTRQRVFTTNQRRAIIARDGGCVIPGCATPRAWCEIHHVHPHSEGGKTHTDNGVALCWYHHRNLDTNGWQIRMDEGVPQIKAPRWLDPHQKWREPNPPTKAPTHRPLSPWAQPASEPRAARQSAASKHPPNPDGPAMCPENRSEPDEPAPPASPPAG